MPDSHLICSTLASAPASPAHSCEGSRQPSLGAPGARCWQRSCRGTAPGNEIPLSTPCTPTEERALPALPALTSAAPSALFPSPHLPVSSPVQLVGGHGPALPLAPWKGKIPLPCFCCVGAEVQGPWLGSQMWEARAEVSHCLSTLSALCLFLLSASIYMAFS